MNLSTEEGQEDQNNKNTVNSSLNIFKAMLDNKGEAI